MKTFEIGQNVWGLSYYKFLALRYAEHYGTTDYKIEKNIMIYIEKYKNEGEIVHKINLDELI